MQQEIYARSEYKLNLKGYSRIMDKLDFQEVQRHINILNVAYHLCLEIVENVGNEHKAICPFCGYNKNSKIPTLSLNAQNNKYCCCRCGAGGFSIGLYAKMKGIDNKTAFKELLDRECFSLDKTPIEISPINILSDIKIRNTIYRDFLSMLKLENQHRRYLKNIGFLDSSIDNNLYRTIPKKYIKRRLICNNLARKYNLAGTPGFYQEEDFKWCFSGMNGFFIPVLNDGYIEGLSIHLDKPFSSTSDLWFSSSNKINGMSAKNWIMRNNVNENSTNLILTDNFIMGDLIKEITEFPVIAFQKITNSYLILKEIEKTNVQNIIFVTQISSANENLDYIIRRVFRDLIPLGYNLDVKCVKNVKDLLDEDFTENYKLRKVA